MSAWRSLAPSGVGALLLVATLSAGGRVFGGAVVVVGVLLVVQLTAFSAAAGLRPLVPGAVVGGVGLPVWRLFDTSVGWNQLVGALGAAVLITFLLALISPRSVGISNVVGATLAVALLVGLGTASLVVLRVGSDGFRWTAGLLALTIVGAVTAVVAGRMIEGALAWGAVVVSSGAVGGVLVVLAQPPFSAPVALCTAVLVAAAMFCSDLLVATTAGAHAQADAQSAQAAAPRGPTPVALGIGLLVAALAVSLLASMLRV